MDVSGWHSEELKTGSRILQVGNPVSTVVPSGLVILAEPVPNQSGRTTYKVNLLNYA